MNPQQHRGSFDRPEPITSLQMAMISRLTQKELGFKPDAFPATYQAAQRLIWALTPSAKESSTGVAES